MGVGVYESNFNETGRTFIVSPPDFDDSSNDDDEDDRSADEISQQAHDDHLEDVVWRIIEAGNELGFDINEHALRYSSKDDSRFVMDKSFTVIIENDFVQVGFRGWESDMIIGVAGAHPDFEDIESNYELFERYSLPLAQLAETYHSLASSVYDYIQLTLQENGIECRVKTSGYTSAEIIVPDDIATQKAALKEVIVALVVKLSEPVGLAEPLSSPLYRENFIRDIYRYNEEYSDAAIEIRVPGVNLETGEIVMISPVEDEFDNDESLPILRSLVDYFAAEGISHGVHEIPLNASTQAFFTELQVTNDALFSRGRSSALIAYVSADEYRVHDDSFEFSLEDDSGESLR